MKYKSARSPRLTLLAAAACIFLAVLAVLTVIYLTVFIKYVLMAFELAVAALVLACQVNTEYELREESLYMKSGFLKTEIPYSDVKTVARTRGYAFFMALAINRLEINAEAAYENGKTVLSPEREDEFLEELAKRCPNMVVTQ